MRPSITYGRRWINNLNKRANLKFDRYTRHQLIIQSGYAGLGDNLFLSHIPRIAKESGKYKKVLVSNRSIFRDPACRMLVWESNQYVDGFTNAPGFELLPPHTHNMRRNRLYEILYALGLENRITRPLDGGNLLDQFMLGMGLDDGFRFHEPEIYLEIPRNKKYERLTVYDPNYITNVGAITPSMVETYFYQAKVDILAQMGMRNNSMSITNSNLIINVANLVEFCSVIVSCKKLYCLTTGTATLAAALKKPCTVLYGDGVNPLFHHSRLHQYVRI